MSARIIPWPVVARPAPPADAATAGMTKAYAPAPVDPVRMARFEPPASLLSTLTERVKPVVKGLIILEVAAALLFLWVALP